MLVNINWADLIFKEVFFIFTVVIFFIVNRLLPPPPPSSPQPPQSSKHQNHDHYPFDAGTTISKTTIYHSHHCHHNSLYRNHYHVLHYSYHIVVTSPPTQLSHPYSPTLSFSRYGLAPFSTINGFYVDFQSLFFLSNPTLLLRNVAFKFISCLSSTTGADCDNVLRSIMNYVRVPSHPPTHPRPRAGREIVLASAILVLRLTEIFCPRVGVRLRFEIRNSNRCECVHK